MRQILNVGFMCAVRRQGDANILPQPFLRGKYESITTSAKTLPTRFAQWRTKEPLLCQPVFSCLTGALRVDKSRPYALESANQFFASIPETRGNVAYSSLRRKKITYPNSEARNTRTQPAYVTVRVCDSGASILLICDGGGYLRYPAPALLRESGTEPQD